MSMREYPNSGYLLPIKEVAHLLKTKEQIELLEKLIADENDVELEKLISQIELLPPCDIWTPCDTDTVDEEEIKTGETYLVFDQDALYEMTPKNCLIEMQKRNVKPIKSSWSIWG
jgi:hypothetical protein